MKQVTVITKENLNEKYFLVGQDVKIKISSATGNSLSSRDDGLFVNASTKNVLDPKAKDYYLSTNEGDDDTGDGTKDNPYKTFDKVIEDAKTNDITDLKVYLQESNVFSIPEDSEITFESFESLEILPYGTQIETMFEKYSYGWENLAVYALREYDSLAPTIEMNSTLEFLYYVPTKKKLAKVSKFRGVILKMENPDANPNQGAISKEGFDITGTRLHLEYCVMNIGNKAYYFVNKDQARVYGNNIFRDVLSSEGLVGLLTDQSVTFVKYTEETTDVLSRAISQPEPNFNPPKDIIDFFNSFALLTPTEGTDGYISTQFQFSNVVPTDRFTIIA